VSNKCHLSDYFTILTSPICIISLKHALIVFLSLDGYWETLSFMFDVNLTP